MVALAAARPNSVGTGNNGNPSYFKPAPAPAAPSATNLFAMRGGGGGYSGDPETWMNPILPDTGTVSYTHLTLPTKRIV